MEAPTPASALIHSSTLVVAGVFLVIRFSTVFEFTVFTNYYMALWGALTLSFGAITATFQNDIKKLVAYSTISQIGYLVCGCGFCCYEEVLLYLIIHALNKAFLFVLVGYTVHFFSGNTDLRQMGGAYLYSFDIAALLFGCCFNLAGLPYSAGFLGKEFLLLQVLRDDFLSLFIRGCWLVSFFFTPIYMFMLVYLAMFSTKKGSIIAYESSWGFSFNAFSAGLSHNCNKLQHSLGYRFQQTSVTSRSTSYFLISFWLFFFFYGETLLLVLFNYSTPIDTISSSSFFGIKQHVVFFLTTTPTKLINFINFYIAVLTASAFLYLTNLNFSYNYYYFRLSFLNTTLVTFVSILCLII
jgi:NADH:ubiquinone oxidoreductase subunit 5 (subunit L)/multisubunit Na+/H+ antiporter MnhA subunit